MLLDLTTAQGDALLRAMREVATVARDRATAADEHAIQAAGTLLLHRDDPVDVEALEPIDAAEFAVWFRDASPEAVERSLEVLVIGAVVDGYIDPAKVERVAAFSGSSGTDPDGLADLVETARDNVRWSIADMSRHNAEALLRLDVDTLAPDTIWPYRVAPDPELAARYAALHELAPGTFGRAFAEFYRANGFAFAGDPDAIFERFGTRHDSTHVLSAYNTTPQGELCVATFTGGMHPERPVSADILPSIYSWHLGIELNPLAGHIKGEMDAAKVFCAWERGTELTTDVFADGWDFWEHVERPLAELRAQYAVRPLEPSFAPTGAPPDWWSPTP